jgi:DcuC family C4-dicarboxylate transporter
MDLTTWLAVGLIAAAVAAIFRGVDVRVALLAAALALGTLAGNVASVVREFLGTFSNEKFVVPICTAMGFARVLGYTGCDSHLVRVLLRPVGCARSLLIPGVVLAGFLINIPVISQSSTAVCLGAVVVPVMRTAGLAPTTIGATLLLGASVGGELLNPGAPELLTVSARTGVPTAQMLGDVLRLVAPLLVVSTLVFWSMDLRAGRKETSPRDQPAGRHEDDCRGSSGPVPPLNPFKAIVPLVPLALLFLSGPPLNWLAVQPEWVVSPPTTEANPAPGPLYGTRLIGLAMLAGVAVAVVATPGRVMGSMKTFFEGAGYGFTHIISLIVTANCFGKSIDQVGLARHLGDLIANNSGLLQPLAAFVSAGFAFVSGSGMASTQSLYGFFHGPAVALGEDPAAVGAMVSVGSAVGRTMSPVAAVVLMCASLTDTRPLDLAKRVGPPLVAGLTATVLLRSLGIL